MKNFNALLGYFLVTGQVFAHMKMSVPASRNMLDVNYGLKAASSICGGYPVSSAPVATYTAGSTISVKLDGSANHNGGGCVFSISQDNGKTFRILHVTNENCPKDLSHSVTLPSDLKAGNAIFSFSWIPVDSGAPEYYHDCADVKIVAATGGYKSTLPDIKLPFYNMPGLTTFWYNNADHSKTLAWVNTDSSLLKFKSLIGQGETSNHTVKSAPAYTSTTTVSEYSTKTSVTLSPTSTHASKAGAKSNASKDSKKKKVSKSSERGNSKKSKSKKGKANKTQSSQGEKSSKGKTVPPRCPKQIKY